MLGVTDAKGQIVNVWASMSAWRKAAFLLLLTVALVVILFIIALTGPKYEVLFSNLTPEDAGEISQRLTEMNISFELSDRGTTILVPENDVYRVRNSLVTEGLPRGGVVDFGIFDETRLGTTEFDQRVQYRRALQGELTRTISAMSGLQNVWVQISMPEQSIYTAREEKASASILLQRTRELSNSQIKGIVHLVANSVEGLEPDQVTVVDTDGEVLSRDILQADDLLGLSGTQAEIKRGIEREVETGIRTLLEMVLGYGRVETRVSADIDFEKKEITSQLFAPEDGEGVLRSIHELERTFYGENGVGAPPGTDANILDNEIPVYQETGAGANEYFEYENTRNFEISEINEFKVVPPGSVERLSVAVIIDEGILEPEQRDAIEEVVVAAAGINYERGDHISITAFPFADTFMPDDFFEDPIIEEEQVRPFYIYILWVIGILAILVFVLLLLHNNRRRAAERREIEEKLAYEEELTKEEAEHRKTSSTIEGLAKKEPEVVAKILRAWLNED